MFITECSAPQIQDLEIKRFSIRILALGPVQHSQSIHGRQRLRMNVAEDATLSLQYLRKERGGFRILSLLLVDLRQIAASLERVRMFFAQNSLSAVAHFSVEGLRELAFPL